MKKIRVTVVLAVLQLLIFTSTPANAGIELVCKGRQARSNHRVIPGGNCGKNISGSSKICAGKLTAKQRRYLPPFPFPIFLTGF